MQILQPLLFLLLCLLLPFLETGRLEAQSGLPESGAAILGAPTDRSVAVYVTFPGNQNAVYVEYGETSSGTFSQQTSIRQAIQANLPYQEVLSNLQRDTEYSYRVRYRTASQGVFSTGPTYTFRTQRPSGSTFSFALQGDSHPERERQMFNSDLYARTLRAVAADHPDFYLTSGDDFKIGRAHV